MPVSFRSIGRKVFARLLRMRPEVDEIIHDPDYHGNRCAAFIHDLKDEAWELFHGKTIQILVVNLLEKAMMSPTDPVVLYEVEREHHHDPDASSRYFLGIQNRGDRAERLSVIQSRAGITIAGSWDDVRSEALRLGGFVGRIHTLASEHHGRVIERPNDYGPMLNRPEFELKYDVVFTPNPLPIDRLIDHAKN